MHFCRVMQMQGGCFHSRTAVGMYDYIKKAVDSGEVMLEWDYSKGQVHTYYFLLWLRFIACRSDGISLFPGDS